VVFNDTANTITAFRDGTQLFQATNVTGTLTTTSDLWISDNGHAANEYWNGLIDRIRISDAALTSAEFIPEPATAGLLSVASLGLLARRRRR
jgi:hypothetical protein